MSGYDDDVGNFVPATPLTNADFRKMLATPRPRVSGSSATPRHPSRPKPAPDQKPKKAPATKSAKIPPPDGEDQDEAAKYRDRAKERREGRSGDYEEVEQELSMHMMHVEGVSDLSKLSVQQSQYLGGDIRRTHWVKGLDYALLAKERERVEKEKADAAKKEAKKEVRIRKEDMEVHSSLARGVIEALFNPPRPDVRELFLPRRTAFVYEMDPEEPWGGEEVPTTLRRSKADCPQVTPSVMGSVDAAALERIAALLQHIKFAAGGKKLKKKEREELLYGPGGKGGADRGKGSMAPPPPRPPKKAAGGGDDEDDGDIFGDAGADYKPAPPPERKGGAAKKKDTYFDTKDDMADIPLPASANRRGGAQEDMEDGEVPPPPPPPPPPAYPPPGQGYGYDQYPQQQGYDYGGYQQAAVGAYMDPQAYQAYVAANVAQQASADPEYQALVARQRSLQELGMGEEEEGRAQPSRAQQGSEKGDDEARWRVKATVKDVEQYAGEVPDDYAECYPNYFTTSNYAEEIVGSDDEGDREQMDSKATLKSRADFDTDEEWHQYKATRDAMPKAAYQFGVKVADGRKPHKDLEKRKDHKLDNQLNKIERLMKDKGHDHNAAFKTPAHDVSLDMPTPRAKRQRI